MSTSFNDVSNTTNYASLKGASTMPTQTYTNPYAGRVMNRTYNFYVDDVDRVLDLNEGCGVFNDTSTEHVMYELLDNPSGDFGYGLLWQDKEGNYWRVSNRMDANEFYHPQVTDEFTFWACDEDGDYLEDNEDYRNVYVSRQVNGHWRYRKDVMTQEGSWQPAGYVHASCPIDAFITNELFGDMECIGDIYELHCEVDTDEEYRGKADVEGNSPVVRYVLDESGVTHQTLID